MSITKLLEEQTSLSQKHMQQGPPEDHQSVSICDSSPFKYYKHSLIFNSTISIFKISKSSEWVQISVTNFQLFNHGIDEIQGVTEFYLGEECSLSVVSLGSQSMSFSSLLTSSPSFLIFQF
ncbi:hypothetical protein ACTFIV_001062 [Dictyostelium citrinum]